MGAGIPADPLQGDLAGDLQEYHGALGGPGDCAKKQGQYFSC